MTSDAVLRGRTVIFLHAHPDDEAIFTGATMFRLASAGARVVLVTATAGELGDRHVRLRPGETLARRRLLELEIAAERLGVARVVPLGYADSGLRLPATDPEALANADLEVVARVVAGLALEESADALVHYDADGIYGHPDHIAVHRIGVRAVQLARLPSYETTVDREYLHFTDPHLVEGRGPRSRRPSVGRTSAEITTAVAADRVALAAKASGMLVHASQVLPDDVAAASFPAVYGTEWFIRRGETDLLERLGNAHVLAAPVAPAA